MKAEVKISKRKLGHNFTNELLVLSTIKSIPFYFILYNASAPETQRL